MEWIYTIMQRASPLSLVLNIPHRQRVLLSFSAFLPRTRPAAGICLTGNGGSAIAKVAAIGGRFVRTFEGRDYRKMSSSHSDGFAGAMFDRENCKGARQ